MKKYQYSLVLGVFTIMAFILSGAIINQDAQGYAQRSTTTSKNYSFKMYNSSRDIRPISSGSVDIPHRVDMIRGGYSVCKAEEIDFSYSNNLIFSAGNGFWDTPYGRWCSSINSLCTSIWNGQKIYDQSDINWWMGKPHPGLTNTQWYNIGLAEDRFKEARIMWTAVKPGSYIISSNPSVVRCSGMDCVALRDGNVTLTAYAQKTQARIWAYVEFGSRGSRTWAWRSEDMPYLNNVRTNKMWMSNSNVRVGSWNINVGGASRCNYCGDGKILNEQCDTSAGSTPVNNCTAPYNGTCRYCVSPGRSGQCTWVTKLGAYCGDGVKNGAEQCDAGSSNGTVCTAAYGGTCTYCSNWCTNATAVGPYCGDNIQNGTEECDNTSANCNACQVVRDASCGTSGSAESSNPVLLDSKPATNLCSYTSSPAVVTGTGASDAQWTWTCTGKSGGASSTCYAQMNPGRIGTTSSPYEYPATNWDGTETFCSFGTSEVPAFPTREATQSSTSWVCSTIGGDSVPPGEALLNPPPISCASPNGETNVNAEPNTPLCSGAFLTPNVVFDDGVWKWDCTHDVVAGVTESCSASSCLDGDPLQIQSHVYLVKNGNPKANVSVNCTNSTNTCCTIHKDGEGSTKINIELGSAPGNSNDVICSNESGKIDINPSEEIFRANCWFDEDGDRINDSNEPTVTNKGPYMVQTMCSERSCNSQGTCQATPKAASNINECKSTCSSNADCSSGRIIEVRP